MTSEKEITADVTAAPNLRTRDQFEREREYDQLWSDFGPSLARLASSYESEPHGREDLLQEIRLAIWVALPRFRGDSSLRTFVFRIAHNRALTHVWRRKRAGIAEEPQDIPDPRSTPEIDTMQRVDQARLIEAIRLLPIPFRQILTLALEDFSHAEIAAILGISENNVAVRMNRARKQLRERLRP
ncbi:MAG: sigma-70 family RNA polymerase sigma factor [Candidatus Sulfotelmatobacter sp.]